MHRCSSVTSASPSGGLTTEDVLVLMSLQQFEGLGPALINRLIDALPRPAALLEAKLDPAGIPALPDKTRKALLSFLRSPRSSVYWEIACRSSERLVQLGAQIVEKSASQFPSLLKELPDCPPFIYLFGNIECLPKRSISIVGTRKPTPYGKAMAESLARDLSDAGLLVVSGMAHGVDAMAHRGALSGKTGTLAVWATGLDRVYPPANASLADRIIKQGAVITEMPLGTPSVAGLFPRRNRIVSGISLGTIVVEAALPSGSLVTANFAAEQNRELFALPGLVSNSQSAGCHQLIRDGATLIESADDVLASLEGFQSVDLQLPLMQGAEEQIQGLSRFQQTVLAAIDAEPAPFELILGRVDAEAEAVEVEALNMALIDLELMGRIIADGGRYSRIPPVRR